MHIVVLEPDPAWLQQRREWGIDQRDEVWDGVLHVVPPASSIHQLVEGDLEYTLRPIAKPLGLIVGHQLGVFDPVRGDTNYRVPDMVVVDPKSISERGIDGRIEIAIEILSPNDESRQKFDFYAKCGVQELWLVDPRTRAHEVYVLRDGRYFAVADLNGVTIAPRLALELSVVDGPKLRIAWAEGSAEI